MLMTMRAYTEGCRALASVAAAAFDAAHHHPDAETRKQNQSFYEFMVPLIKGYSTEMSLEVTSLGVQVHGGMGFIEETGCAQYYRDAKILTIYEGTTAIQANDLVGRKTARDGGQTAKALAAQIEATEAAADPKRHRRRAGCRQAPEGRPRCLHRRGGVCLKQHPDPTQRCLCRQRALPDAGGQPDGGLAARRAPCWWRRSRSTKGVDMPFMQAKITTARFYADHLLTKAPGLRDSIVDGAACVTELALEAF